MEVGLFCHPNDIAQGLDLDDLRDSGLGRLIVNVLYHDWTCWTPLSATRPLRREFGGKSAVPVGAGYPRELAPAAGDSGSLRQLTARALDAGLAVDAWTVGLHRDDLACRGSATPLVTTDAFGATQLAWICPSSAAALAYLEAHVRDAANGNGFTRIILEGCHYPLLPHGGGHERDLSRLPVALTERLELCFCATCRAAYAAHGIEESWREAIRAEITAGVAVGPEARLGEVAQLRRERVLELLAAIRGAAPPLGTVFADQPAIAGHPFRTGQPGSRPRDSIHAAAGIDAAAIAASGTRVMALAYFRAPADVVRHVEGYLDAGIAPATLIVVLRAAAPDSDSRADLHEKLRLLAALGVREVSFYELTQLDAAEWALTRGAIDFAAAA